MTFICDFGTRLVLKPYADINQFNQVLISNFIEIPKKGAYTEKLSRGEFTILGTKLSRGRNAIIRWWEKEERF